MTSATVYLYQTGSSSANRLSALPTVGKSIPRIEPFQVCPGTRSLLWPSQNICLSTIRPSISSSSPSVFRSWCSWGGRDVECREVLEIQSWGFPPRIFQLWEMAEELIQAKGDYKDLGTIRPLYVHLPTKTQHSTTFHSGHENGRNSELLWSDHPNLPFQYSRGTAWGRLPARSPRALDGSSFVALS